jgi:hypothetical protein
MFFDHSHSHVYFMVVKSGKSNYSTDWSLFHSLVGILKLFEALWNLVMVLFTFILPVETKISILRLKGVKSNRGNR